MSTPSSSANQELPDHELDIQAGSDEADDASSRAQGKGVMVGHMSPEELENFKRKKKQEELRDSPWGQLFT